MPRCLDIMTREGGGVVSKLPELQLVVLLQLARAVSERGIRILRIDYREPSLIVYMSDGKWLRLLLNGDSLWAATSRRPDAIPLGTIVDINPCELLSSLGI